MDKTKEFAYPELKIESQIDDLYMFRYLKNNDPKNFKIKSRLLGNVLTEYDSNGNIISETKNESDLYDKKTFYTYKNGILVEKITTSKAHKERIKRRNTESELQAKRDMERNGIATSVIYDSEDTEDIYNAELDKKNRIISTTNKSFTIANGEKKLTKVNITKIDYSGNKITKIKSGNSKSFFEINYFYEGNLLVRKESINGGTDVMHYQQNKKIYKYKYDKEKNLVAIYNVDEYYIKGKRNDNNTLSLKDSANYDNKNRMIWHGNKYRYETFKYDKNNNITEYSKFRNDKSEQKLDFRHEYEYYNNKIVRYSETDNRFSTAPRSYSQKLIYDNGLLKEIQNSSEKVPIGAKTVYEYNDKNQLIKISEYIPKSFKNKNAPENEFELSEITQYIYNDKTLIIKGKYSTIAEYIFY